MKESYLFYIVFFLNYEFLQKLKIFDENLRKSTVEKADVVFHIVKKLRIFKNTYE